MSELVMARATVHLVGLGPGVPVLVDPEEPQIKRWLAGGQLIEEKAPLVIDPPAASAPVSRETPARKAPVRKPRAKR